jgi:hypothetical protein
LIDVAGYFRVDAGRAREVLREVLDATSSWRQVADQVGLSRTAAADMAPAFEHARASEAQRIARWQKRPAKRNVA